MMAVQSKRYTVDEFDELVMLPENADKRLEYVGGEIVEVVSNSYSSEIAAQVIFLIKLFMREKGVEGRVTGSDGGYKISGERYIPDVAFTAIHRQPEPSYEAYNSITPDLAVEVLSPSNKSDDMRLKIMNYILAETTVWVVDPDYKTVEVYIPGQKPQRLRLNDVLDGGEVLPGFQVAVKDIFPD